MPELRALVTSLGHRDVATYIQSGNVVLSAREGSDEPSLAAELEQAIAANLGVPCRVVVLTRDELAQVVRDNPYPDEPNPKAVHALFLPAAPGPDAAAGVAAAEQRAAAKGSRDTATLVGRTLYLHTPDGFGRSELAVQLGRGGGLLSPSAGGTARNWATVTKLLELCES
jgi:uncharacterized protein (DUF1697 family)